MSFEWEIFAESYFNGKESVEKKGLKIKVGEEDGDEEQERE